MRSINFNDNFFGFEDNEDILMDTNVIYAFLNSYDAWHSTVRNLFNNYILSGSVNLFLYTHSGIINEVTYLSKDPLRNYSEYHEGILSEQDITIAVNDILSRMRRLIDQEVLLILDSNKESILKQIDYAMYFGAMDSLIVSLVNEYGISLLTVDNRLVNNLLYKQVEFPNIRNLYYTNPAYKDY